MPGTFSYGVKAIERMASKLKSGMMSAEHFTAMADKLMPWSTRFRPGIGAALNNTLIDSDRSMALSASIATHIASQLKLRQDESAWDFYRPSTDPGQVVLLRSAGGAQTLEYYDAPASANPAVLTNRLSLSPTQFTNAFVGPRALVRRTTNQSIVNITAQVVTFDTADGLVSNGYGGGTSMWNGASRLVAPVSGWYIVFATAIFQNVGAGIYREWGIWKNGAGWLTQSNNDNPFSASFFAVGNPGGIVYMNANEYVELVVYQDSGAALNIVASTNSPRLGLIYICP